MWTLKHRHPRYRGTPKRLRSPSPAWSLAEFGIEVVTRMVANRDSFQAREIPYVAISLPRVRFIEGPAA